MMLLASLFRFVFWLGWLVPLAFLWLLRPSLWVLVVSLVLASLTSGPAHAGWLWSNHPDPKTEAANQALERAARIATEAARTQSGQQAQYLQAVEALAHERTRLAGHLQAVGELANRDSAWAAALHAAGPVLISAGALGVAALAIWLATRAGSHDAELASVLADELAGTRQFVLGVHKPRGQFPGLPYENVKNLETHPDSLSSQQEMPF